MAFRPIHLLVTAVLAADAWVPKKTLSHPRRIVPRATESDSSPALLKISTPSQDEAVSRGIREWPGFLKKGQDFTEPAKAGATVRYVYGGRGKLAATGADGSTQIADISPNTLIEVDAPCELSWTIEEPLTLLTPDFEQLGLFAGVALSLVAVFGYLLANSAG